MFSVGPDMDSVSMLPGQNEIVDVSSGFCAFFWVFIFIGLLALLSVLALFKRNRDLKNDSDHYTKIEASETVKT